MKAAIFLRVASLLALVHAAMHTAGGVFGAVPPGPASVAVAAMRANWFGFMGATRNYWEFHRGMGLMVTVFLTVDAVLFWLLSRLVKTDGARLRPLLAMFCLGYFALAVLSLVYFFALPVIVEALIALCLAGAWATASANVASGEPKQVAAAG